MLCSEAITVNQGVDAARAVTLKCRAWSCPICAPDRKKQLVALAKSGKPTTFITLTSNPAVGCSPGHRARLLVEAWRQVVKRARKKYSIKHIPYLCVFEATKKGEPHVHILARVKYIPQKWLAKQMKELNSAPNVWINEVKNKSKMAYYIAKYCGKEPHRFSSCKRYWSTRSWELTTYEREEMPGYWARGWDIREQTLSNLETTWRAWGWDVEYLGKMLVGRAREPPPWRRSIV